MSDENASVQVSLWARAITVRVDQTDRVSFQKSLRDEAAKELTESLRADEANGWSDSLQSDEAAESA
jgi:hypothetical protein